MDRKFKIWLVLSLFFPYDATRRLKYARRAIRKLNH